ncbi:hypothetical protein ADUPG1_009831 [Aduncisulcus paluster]|uniref:Uncharacterized protein n=1 Tax=Aduncisulcus paluster TaxID=2918883 RepID=A0ABQ5KZM6_9EUKA|nr:hypothetical protein ADUPG1_009831 [Aduncisulcus paluster]
MPLGTRIIDESQSNLPLTPGPTAKHSVEEKTVKDTTISDYIEKYGLHPQEFDKIPLYVEDTSFPEDTSLYLTKKEAKIIDLLESERKEEELWMKQLKMILDEESP